MPAVAIRKSGEVPALRHSVKPCRPGIVSAVARRVRLLWGCVVWPPAGRQGLRSRLAIRNGIARASQTLRGLDWFEATEIRGHIVDGEIGHFQVTMKVGFRLED